MKRASDPRFRRSPAMLSLRESPLSSPSTTRNAARGESRNADLSAASPRSWKVGLVPGGNDPFRLDAQVLEHVGRDAALLVDARRRSIEHVQHDVRIADLGERRAE